MAITPTWTSPVEYTTGQLVTAANMNAMQNNIQFLHTYGVRKAANGTAGRIPFWANANDLTDSADIFWDATNKFFGIGTSAPARSLHINHEGATIRLDRRDTAMPGMFLSAWAGGGAANPTKVLYMGGIGTSNWGVRDHGTVVGGGGTVLLEIDGTNGLPMTIGNSKVMPLRARQGGNGTNWATAGTTNYNAPDALVQTGVDTITIGGGTSGATGLTFPVAFAGTPVFNYSIYGISAGVTHSISSISASGASVNINNNSGGSLTFNVHWIAIGPRP